MSINKYEQNVNLDLNSNQAYVVVNAKQWDQNTRQLNISFTQDGVQRNFSSSSNAGLQFRLRKPDGTSVILDSKDTADRSYISKSSDNKIAHVVLTSQCLAAAGRGYADLLEYEGADSSNQEIISAASFILNIMSAPNVLTNLKSESQYSSLFEAVDAAIASASYAAASAAIAIEAIASASDAFQYATWASASASQAIVASSSAEVYAIAASSSANMAAAAASSAYQYYDEIYDLSKDVNRNAVAANSAASRAETAWQNSNIAYASAATSAAQAKTSASQAIASASQAIVAASSAQTYADDALGYSRDAEAWAIGSRDGSAIPSSDPAYNNNAKYWATVASATVSGMAPLASPSFTGTPTAPNPNSKDNSGKIATTHYVDTAILEAFPTESSYDTVSSTEIGANNLLLKDLTIDINPIQDLNSEQMPWPEGILNKFNVADCDVVKGNQYGLTVSISDEYIILSGTCNESGKLSFDTIIVNSEQKDIVNTLQLKAFLMNSSAYIESIDNASYDYETGIISLSVDRLIAGTAYNIEIGILGYEFGQDNSKWISYAGNVCPIYGWTGLEVFQSNENLFDRNNIEEGFINEYGVLDPDSTGCHSIYIPVMTGQILVFSGSYSDIDSTNIRVHGYNKDKTWRQQLRVVTTTSNFEFTVTIPKNIYYIVLSLAKSIYNPQINFGSNAISYKDYQGKIYQFNWYDTTGTVYGARLIDNHNNTWTLSKDFAYAVANSSGQLIIEGGQPSNFSGNVSNGGYAYVNTDDIYKPKPYESGNGICSLLRTDYIFDGTKDNKYTPYRTGGGTGRIAFKISTLDGWTTTSGQGSQNGQVFQNWVAEQYSKGNILQACWKIETPITYILSEESVKSLFKVNNIWTNSGNTSSVFCCDPTLYVENKLKTPPTIIIQPTDFIGAIDDTAKFFVGAYSLNGVTYQWQVKVSDEANWVNSTSSGNKTDTLTVSITQTRLAYRYRCIITSDGGNVTTNEVKLVISEN